MNIDGLNEIYEIEKSTHATDLEDTMTPETLTPVTTVVVSPDDQDRADQIRELLAGVGEETSATIVTKRPWLYVDVVDGTRVRVITDRTAITSLPKALERQVTDMRDRPELRWTPMVFVVDPVDHLGRAEMDALRDVQRLAAQTGVTVILGRIQEGDSE